MTAFPFHRAGEPLDRPAGWIVTCDDGKSRLVWNKDRHETELERRLREFTCCGDPGDCSENRCR